MSKPLVKVKKEFKKLEVKKPTHFYLKIFSRHPSSKGIRKTIPVKGKNVVYRHGSTTEGNFEYEINSVESIKNSADKLKMKECFDNAEVKQAIWIPLVNFSSDKKSFTEFLNKLDFGKDKESFIIIKHRLGSRGTGNYLIKSQQELDAFIKNKQGSLKNYIVEEYKRYSVEYRIHATEYGYFYACRKMLKSNTPKTERFQRHDDNCVWYIESNPVFDKPSNWNEIVKDCQRAVKAMGADVLAFDVKCTSTKGSKDKTCKWIIIESCSAPSFGDGTTVKYKEELPKIINYKYEKV